MTKLEIVDYLALSAWGTLGIGSIYFFSLGEFSGAWLSFMFFLGMCPVLLIIFEEEITEGIKNKKT